MQLSLRQLVIIPVLILLCLTSQAQSQTDVSRTDGTANNPLDCAEATQKLHFIGATKSWDCQTDQTGGGGGITTLNTLTTAVQTFATPGTTGAAPNWSSVTDAHTLHIPLAATASVTAGLISKSQFDIFNGKQDALGFTPENSANKNVASGYAGLTAGTKLTAGQGQEVWGVADLTDFASKNGSGTAALGATITAPADNQCLTYDLASTAWINETCPGGGGGITTLNTLTAAVQTFATPGTSGTAPNWSSVTDAHTLHIPLAATATVTAGLISKSQFDVFNGKQDALGFTPENSANKNVASGYAGLTAGTKLTAAQGQEVWGVADLTDFASKNGSGTAALGATITLPADNQCLTYDLATTAWINETCPGGGGGITTLNTLTAAVQTFATPGTSGTAPNWSSVTDAHTLHIPLAATATVTAGLISKSQFDVFNGKQDALGFTPENAANKNAASGYAGLDGSVKLAAAQLPNPGATTLGGIKSLTCSGTDKLSAVGTDGLPVCSTDQTGAGGGESENIVRTTSDVTNSTTTFADVTGLTFSATASADYIFEAWLIFQSNTLTTGIKFAVNGPGSPVAIVMNAHIPIGLTLYASSNMMASRAYNTGTPSASVDTINANLLGHVVGIFRNGTTTGPFAIRFAAETTGIVKVVTGSVLRYRQVN